MKPETSDISMRIAILRFVMIVGIVLLHTPMYVPITDIGSSWFDLTKAFFQSAVFRCTVPVLTLISGYLLFNARLDTDYRKLLSKKVRTLLIPFLVFNLGLVGIIYFIQSSHPLTMSYQLYPFKFETMRNAAFGLTTAPIDYPLYFVRDLFVLCLLSPIFGWMLRHAALAGVSVIVLLFSMNLDGNLILRSSMPLMFYLGGMAAVKNWNLRLLDRYASLCLALFVAICAGVIAFRIANTTYLRLVAPLLIWPSTVLLADTRIGAWLARMSKYSYFIFLAHAPLLTLTWVVYGKWGASVPYELYWITAPLMTVVLLVTFYQCSIACVPRLFGLLTGTKVAASAPAVVISFRTASAQESLLKEHAA